MEFRLPTNMPGSPGQPVVLGRKPSGLKLRNVTSCVLSPRSSRAMTARPGSSI
jgi:hypothetical protein